MATLSWATALLGGLRPAFGKGERASAEGASVPLAGPGLALRLHTVDEIVSLDGDVTSESVKATFFVQRLPDVAEADYFQHWREKHLPNVRAALQRNPGGLRYVVSQADQGQPGPWSGLAELYWQDADAERAGLPGQTDYSHPATPRWSETAMPTPKATSWFPLGSTVLQWLPPLRSP